MRKNIIIKIIRTTLWLALVSTFTACATGGTVDTSSSDKSATDTVTSRTLVLTIQGTTPETVIGAVDVSIEMPPGVSVKTQENGMLINGVLISSPSSTQPYLMGKFSNRTLRIAMISPTRIKGGEVMQLSVDVAKGVMLSAESFQISSMRVIDLNGKAVDGINLLTALK